MLEHPLLERIAAGLPPRMGDWVRMAGSRFARDTLLLTGVTALERAAALVQTMLVARALGIAEYGVYGLLFNTIGLVSSIVGLQMGLTATVLVARHRADDKPRAAAVIAHVSRFALIVGVLVIAVALPFARPLAEWLLQSGQYAGVIVLSAAFIAFSLYSGVQDGIAQGFEDFRAIALVRTLAVVVTSLAIWPAARLGGLTGVVLAILAGMWLKIAVLGVLLARMRKAHALPARGHGIAFWDMVLGFSLPSMLASLLLGGATWWGSYLLSRYPAGFESVAIVNTGLQWRGPVLLVAASIGSVAVPAFARLAGRDDRAGSRTLRRRLLLLNAVAATLAVLAIIACSGPLLRLYGAGFAAGGAVFAILVATAAPLVLANVFMQALVGAGRLWRQFWLHIPVVVVMVAGFAWWIPRSGGLGYALALAVSSLVFLACAVAGRLRGPTQVSAHGIAKGAVARVSKEQE